MGGRGQLPSETCFRTPLPAEFVKADGGGLLNIQVTPRGTALRVFATVVRDTLFVCEAAGLSGEFYYLIQIMAPAS